MGSPTFGPAAEFGNDWPDAGSNGIVADDTAHDLGGAKEDEGKLQQNDSGNGPEHGFATGAQHGRPKAKAQAYKGPHPHDVAAVRPSGRRALELDSLGLLGLTLASPAAECSDEQRDEQRPYRREEEVAQVEVQRAKCHFGYGTERNVVSARFWAQKYEVQGTFVTTTVPEGSPLEIPLRAVGAKVQNGDMATTAPRNAARTETIWRSRRSAKRAVGTLFVAVALLGLGGCSSRIEQANAESQFCSFIYGIGPTGSSAISVTRGTGDNFSDADLRSAAVDFTNALRADNAGAVANSESQVEVACKRLDYWRAGGKAP